MTCSLQMTPDRFDYEQIQLRKKIDEITSEIRQLENNLQFFSDVASDNPMVADVHKNIDKKRTELDSYQSKMTAIRKMIREEDEIKTIWPVAKILPFLPSLNQL